MDSLPESTVTTFIHEPLPDAANHIRLLEVLDEGYSDSIKVCCRMTTWPTDSIPPYHAISYTWGDPDSNTTILINNQPFSVRKNCEFVLKQARWHAKSRYYWVDAICIDQENLNEKSKQVAMMGIIYKRADHILACVGDHTDDSLFLFQNLERFSPFWSTDRSIALRLYWRFGFSTIRRFVRACLNFAKRPYFGRLWVLQELKNSRQASLLCGRDAVSRLRFLNTLIWLILRPQATIQKPIWKLKLLSSVLRTDAAQNGQISKMYQLFIPKTSATDFMENESSLYCMIYFLNWTIDPENLVRLTYQLQCTIPKDKVYGIILILDPEDHAPIIPDYTKSEFQIALDFLHAIWNTDFIQNRNTESGLASVCFYTLANLNINPQNIVSILEALEARRGPPEEVFEDAELGPKGPLPPAPTLATGYRVSIGDLIQGNNALFKCWHPRGAEKVKVFLPDRALEGDWVVHIKDPTEESKLFLLVLREVAESPRIRIVGHGYSASFDSRDLVGSKFEILWHPEDILVFVFTQLVLKYRKENYKEREKALTSSVCRRETPGSSYGIKLSQKYVPRGADR